MTSTEENGRPWNNVGTMGTGKRSSLGGRASLFSASRGFARKTTIKAHGGSLFCLRGVPARPNAQAAAAVAAGLPRVGGEAEGYFSNQPRMVSMMELLTVNGPSQLHMFRIRSYIIIPQSISSKAQNTRPAICQPV